MAAKRSTPELMPHEVLTVDLGERSYPIAIGAEILDDFGPHLAQVATPGRCAVVSNPTVAGLYGERVLQSLRQAGFTPLLIEIPDGEAYKTLDSLAQVYDALIDAKLERSSLLVALGGGVVGDLTGFAAATYLRGVPFAQVPTTLLAQVDSSVGGKTGVNRPGGKNLVGAFYQPRLVLIDLATLRTLPRRELVAGLVEVIKYGVILDADLFGRLEQTIDRLLALDTELLQTVVRRSCELKAQVVRMDEREQDHRAILNFGHTLGHALESVTDYEKYLHGEAVAIGMAFAARLSAARGLCEPEAADRVVRLLKKLGAPVDVPAGLDEVSIASAVASDKKVAGARVKFVCMEGIGRTRFELVSAREIAELAVRQGTWTE